MTTLFRGPVLWVTQLPFVRRTLSERPLGRRIAERFVPGDSLEDGIEAARQLNQQRIGAMLDLLGENVSSPAQAVAGADVYIRALKRIRESPYLDCQVSVKLTQLGLDVGRDVCVENMERVLTVAAEAEPRILVMIDMEARAYVDPTLDVYLSLRDRYPNMGVALQSYLFRTEQDVRGIAGPQAIVRMVKGAYLEPPDVAYQRMRDIRRSFARLTATLLAAGSTVHVATHDPQLIEGAKRFVHAGGISNRRYEFQMLYGVRRDLQASLVREGEPVRVYIPYGTEWYPYLTRRLAERPANLWFFVSNLVRR